MTQAAKQKRTVRYRSKWNVLGLPLISIAFGPDSCTKQSIGLARGIIAIGDMATGVIAIGGVAGGAIAIGGVSLGGVAIGGITVGGLILGGIAVGGIACGGVAIGHYARGGAVIGTYVVGTQRRDAEAVKLFETISPGSLPPERPAAEKKEVPHE
jgi:hypothetical protein